MLLFALIGSGRRSPRFLIGLFGFLLVVFLVTRWAEAHPNRALPNLLFRWRVVSTKTVLLLAFGFFATYAAIIVAADRLKLLDHPAVLTAAFFSAFLGMMASAAAVIRGFKLLRGRTGGQ